MLGDVFDFQEQLQRVSHRHLGHRTVEDAVHTAGGRPRQFALHHAFTAQACAFEQHQQRFGAAREFGEATAERLIGAETEQRLRSRIQIGNMQILIEQEDAGDQRIEQLRALDDLGLHLELSSQAEGPPDQGPASGLLVLRRQLGGLSHVERHTGRGL